MVSMFDPMSIPASGVTWTIAVWMGVLALLNLCALIRLPILAAYVAGVGGTKKHSLLVTVLFALGLVGGTVLLGLMATPLADGVHKALQVDKRLFWILGLCLILLGICLSRLVDGLLALERWRHVRERLGRTDLLGALLLGLVLGLSHTPACPTCRAELLTVVEGSSVSGAPLGGLMLLGFAAGQCLVVLAIGVLTAVLRPSLFLWLRTRMCSLEQRMQLLTGNMLVVVGIYFALIG